MPLRSFKRLAPLLFVLLTAALLPVATDAAPPAASRTLDDYRHFRVASIDLVGRMPTREEIADFERPTWSFDRWVDQHLKGPAYVERLTRIYMDLLRLEPNLNFSTGPAQLFRQEIQGPDGKPVLVYYRPAQRRAREATDGNFCLAPDETGLVVRPGAQQLGVPKKVGKKVLDQYTTLVKPWWLYRDYKGSEPEERYGGSWTADADFRPAESLLTDPDGKPTIEIRVCREEAQILDHGTIYASGRTKAPPPQPPKPVTVTKTATSTSTSTSTPTPTPTSTPTSIKTATPKPGPPAQPPNVPLIPSGFAGGRLKPAPLDKPYAVQHKGEPVACDTRQALDMSIDCGCGPGLERCVPNDANNNGNAFYFPNHAPLGPGMPLDSVRQQAQRWFPYWWSREAVHFLDYLFDQDRDFREILTGHETLVNGPLAQFYRTIQRGNCCGVEASFGMTEEREPLFDSKNVPTDLTPQDTSTWKLVANRGPHAAGILTSPMFLEKYASARARGAVLYTAFLCKSFVSENAQLTPSDEPNLMKRPGCQNCHATLEPLAAYFARVEPGNFIFLPESSFPARNATCKKDKQGRLNGQCNALYDVAFTDASGATLRSAYGSTAHADAAPAGAGQDIVTMPEFAECAVQRVTSSFLGRPTTPDDAELVRSLTDGFKQSGFRMRELVRGIVRSDAYRRANNLSSTTWRGDDAQEGGSR